MGKATAQALAQEDANGAVVELAAESAEETVAPINRAGGQAMSLTGDITDATAVSTQMKCVATRTARS
jgi:NAD(P)-dependent dehydrogenase (short-subunit alcohol dehydrogenase family)